MSVPPTLLGLSERGPSHGYDLKRDYNTWFGRGKPLPYGQVSGELVMILLTAAAREQGSTVILVTHDARAAACAGREVIVRDGTVNSLAVAAPSAGTAQ